MRLSAVYLAVLPCHVNRATRWRSFLGTSTMRLTSRLICSAVGLLALVASQASANEDFATWPRLTPEFESTGGGGIMIRGYDPVVTDDKCTTNFTAHEPGANGKVYANAVTFDARAEQGGILCSNGRWRALDGSATGTTPLRVFIKDGIKRRSPG
jgi:hypothetical protein